MSLEQRLGWGLLIIYQQRQYKSITINLSLLYVEFTQMHNIDLSEIAQFVKAVIKTSRYHSLGFNPLCGQWRLSVKVSYEWRLNLGLGTQKRCPLPLNRGISSIKVTDTKTMWAFFRDQILCQLNEGVRWIEVSQRRGSEYHCYEIVNFRGGLIPLLNPPMSSGS